ncbi:MAG: phosphatase PAP2 family protein [Ignavibacteriales bacterium]
MSGLIGDGSRPRRSKRLITIVLGIVCLLIYIILAQKLLSKDLIAFDQLITAHILAFSSPTATKIMIFITYWGNTWVAFLVALIGIFIIIKTKRGRWSAKILLMAVTGASIAVTPLKNIFHRSRPLERLLYFTGYSFPSGHAMISSALYGMIAYLLWINLRSSFSRYIAVFALVLLILLIGFSRIYLGAHYPSDVLAGYAAGGLWLIICIYVLDAISTRT